MTAFRLTLGDVTITSLIEWHGPFFRPQDVFPRFDQAVFEDHMRSLDPVTYDPASGNLVLTFQTFVVQTPHHTMLVDTCVGDHKGFDAGYPFPKQPWLDNFNAAGLRFEEIDYVFCTHLHVDHCGWNTVLRDGRWVPTFPNAKYVFHKREYAAWEAFHRHDPEDRRSRVWQMNCEPVVAAGQALLVGDDYQLDDTVTLTPTPGHSPCHCCVNIHSRGQTAVITGDLMHHAVQIREPDWSTKFDVDQDESAASRRRLLESVADTPAIVLPIHFPYPTAGRVTPRGRGFDLRYLGATMR